MLFESAKRVVLQKPSGDIIIAEVFIRDGVVFLSLGPRRLDLHMESALDLADAILQVSGETYSEGGWNV